MSLGDAIVAAATAEQAATHGDYFSHSDIATEAFSETGVPATGGNVGDTVARTTYRSVGGTWMDARNAKHLAFCVIRALGWLGE